MNRIETNLEQKLATFDGGPVLNSLLEIKIGGKEFSKVKRYETMGRIYINGARDVWSSLSKLRGETEEIVFSKIAIGKIKPGLESAGEREGMSLKEVITEAQNYGLDACKPEVVFCVALKMFEDKSFSDEVFVLGKIEDNYRVFVVERDNDGDISVDLYDDFLVNKGSEFDDDEEFVFALSSDWDKVDIVF